jgi:hypothetical protein
VAPGGLQAMPRPISLAQPSALLVMFLPVFNLDLVPGSFYVVFIAAYLRLSWVSLPWPASHYPRCSPGSQCIEEVMVNVFFIEHAILLPIIEKSLANQISEIHIASASKTLFKKEPVVCSLSWFFPLTVSCLSAYCKPRSGHEQWDWGLRALHFFSHRCARARGEYRMASRSGCLSREKKERKYQFEFGIPFL